MVFAEGKMVAVTVQMSVYGIEIAAAPDATRNKAKIRRGEDMFCARDVVR